MSDNLPGNDHQSNPVPPPPAPSSAPNAQAAPNAHAAPSAPPYTGSPAYAGGPAQPKGLALTALILGILSLIFCWVPIAGAVGGIVALVLGILALRKAQPKGLALTGLITGAVAAVIGIIVTILFFVGLSLLGGSIDDAQQAVEACQSGAETVEIAGQTVSCSNLDY
ncbi:DUF4190 domain-containing protein [Leucobacter chromiiresistens]|uniref:DUF4190 domain-containing protein n=1 Tax=Leucobacter chromiiresistens TaxID=1079994 RepID=A0A1H1BHY7_9MICO|nr:DUF4190 domain-containing protein [Leucobacter chromiiresistens]SDQ51552.1 hypothetical protein SAMN04488565_2837 [Leucobacter chromiiresistens]